MTDRGRIHLRKLDAENSIAELRVGLFRIDAEGKLYATAPRWGGRLAVLVGHGLVRDHDGLRFKGQIDVLRRLARQFQVYDNGIVVKDDIEYGFLNVIPLWALGLNY